jgi:hypothetical protein
LPDGSLLLVTAAQYLSSGNANTPLIGRSGASLPDLGSTFVATIKIEWFPEGFEDNTVIGHVELLFTQYQTTLQGSSQVFPITDACYPAKPATAGLSSHKGTVGSTVSFVLHRFSEDPGLAVYFGGKQIGSVATDKFGNATGSFVVPEAPAGATTVTFASDGRTDDTGYTVTPSIQVFPSGTVLRGQVVTVALRGYPKNSLVYILWKKGTSWVSLTSVRTGGTGSANTYIKVPSFAVIGTNSVRGDGDNTLAHAETGAVTVAASSASLSPTSGIVNSGVSFSISWFPPNTTIGIKWDSTSLGTIQTNSSGKASGSFRVPAAPMGKHTVRWSVGSITAQRTFTVVPRIKVIPGTVSRGQTVNFSLRGYAKYETVRIRWKKGSTWVEIGRVRTSGTGSANAYLKVPAWAPDGPASVRGDSLNSTGGRAQTNAVTVSGGTYRPAEATKTPTPSPAATKTPTATATPKATSTPVATASPTTTSTVGSPTPSPPATSQPSATAEPSQSPTAEPTSEAPQPSPTATPTDTVEATSMPLVETPTPEPEA